jgi:2'-5' RNA ligase
MPNAETMRTFIAVPLSEEVIAGIDAVQRSLKRRVPDGAVRWVRPKSIHLTLFFLGDILPNRVKPVQDALSTIARHMPPFDFRAAGLGVFPNLRRPRVIWVGVEDASGGLSLLHDAINEAMVNIGFAPDNRRFSPHLTLGRVRRRASRRDVGSLADTIANTEVGQLGTVAVRSLIFFQSVLKPTGAEYTALDTFDLKG